MITTSEGNPLFLEEMATLAREGVTAEVPPTIQALLAARLERLAPNERELLERGAVEGQVFHRLGRPGTGRPAPLPASLTPRWPAWCERT